MILSFQLQTPVRISGAMQSHVSRKSILGIEFDYDVDTKDIRVVTAAESIRIPDGNVAAVYEAPDEPKPKGK